jgi:chromosome segregation ATPase
MSSDSERKNMTMTILRTIQEVPELPRLEKIVDESAQTAEGWRSKVRSIEAQIAKAHSRCEKADAHRKNFALEASLGNPQAIGEITAARVEFANAEDDITDLQHALDGAKLKLAEAEREAKTARNNLTTFELNILKRKSVAAAVHVDNAIAAFVRAFSDFQKIEDEIGNANVPNVHGIYADHGASTLRRVRAALPKLFERIMQPAVYDEMQKMPLAKSVASHWGLPPIESEKAA